MGSDKQRRRVMVEHMLSALEGEMQKVAWRGRGRPPKDTVDKIRSVKDRMRPLMEELRKLSVPPKPPGFTIILWTHDQGYVGNLLVLAVSAENAFRNAEGLVAPVRLYVYMAEDSKAPEIGQGNHEALIKQAKMRAFPKDGPLPPSKTPQPPRCKVVPKLHVDRYEINRDPGKEAESLKGLRDFGLGTIQAAEHERGIVFLESNLGMPGQGLQFDQAFFDAAYKAKPGYRVQLYDGSPGNRAKHDPASPILLPGYLTKRAMDLDKKVVTDANYDVAATVKNILKATVAPKS
jgi:hypothetical protein